MSPDLKDEDTNQIVQKSASNTTTNQPQPPQTACHSRSLQDIRDIEASMSANIVDCGGAAMMTRRKKGVKEVTKNTKKKKLDEHEENDEEEEPCKRKRINLDESDSSSSSSSRNLLRLLRSGKKTNNYLVSLKNQQGIAKLAENRNQNEFDSSKTLLRPITRGQKARAAKEPVDVDEVFGKLSTFI